MSIANDRYQQVRDVWPEEFPPITRVEAERAARKLIARFAPKGKKKWRVRTRQVWVSPRPTKGHWKGWGRLIHDISHDVFEWTYPTRRPHDPLHVHYETEVAKYVMEKGWLDGKLKPPPKKKPTLREKREAELKRTMSGVTRASFAVSGLKRSNPVKSPRPATAAPSAAFLKPSARCSSL